jgi:serine/threonine-protein kinase
MKKHIPLILVCLLSSMILACGLSARSAPVIETDGARPQVAMSTQPAASALSETRVADKDGMTLLYVPAGNFTMGSTIEQAVRECEQTQSDCREILFKSETPPHTVDLPAYWIDQTEVSNTMYALCVQSGNCQPPSDTAFYGNAKYANHPVVFVSWNDANAYCEWSGRRLPTEAEWEKAARGTDERTYPWGNNLPTCTLANLYGCVNGTSPVGSYSAGASPYGALDMAGNVWEWTASPHEAYPGNTDGFFGGKGYRVIRGGSGSDGGVRVAHRNDNYGPGYGGNLYLGFRCVRSD